MSVIIKLILDDARNDVVTAALSHYLTVPDSITGLAFEKLPLPEYISNGILQYLIE